VEIFEPAHILLGKGLGREELWGLLLLVGQGRTCDEAGKIRFPFQSFAASDAQKLHQHLSIGGYTKGKDGGGLVARRAVERDFMPFHMNLTKNFPTTEESKLPCPGKAL
jgi:hypothetical protein